MVTSPLATAECNGVSPSFIKINENSKKIPRNFLPMVSMLTIAPDSKRIVTIELFPVETAKCNGENP